MEKIPWQAKQISAERRFSTSRRKSRDLDRRAVYDILVDSGSYGGTSYSSFSKDIHRLDIGDRFRDGAVVHAREVVQIVDTVEDAIAYGAEQYDMGNFIAQEITDMVPTILLHAMEPLVPALSPP